MAFAVTGRWAFAASLGWMAFFLCFPAVSGEIRAQPQTIAQDGQPALPQLALSDLKDLEMEEEGPSDFGGQLPVPPKLGAPTLKEPGEAEGSTERGDLPDMEISSDLSLLPEPVRRMRQLLVEAAKSGNPENLRPLLGTGPSATQLSFGLVEGDPIQFLKDTSGDGNGREMLAILLDILDAGYAHLDAGEPTETFIWPYFYTLPLNDLDDKQMVELFRIITAGDLQDMRAFGSYSFYRTGISANGEWLFFLAGD